MKKILPLIVCAFCSAMAQETAEITNQEKPPLIVTWSFTAYSGVALPFEPYAFTTYWNKGSDYLFEMDMLLRNDWVFAVSAGFSKLRFKAYQYWRDYGAEVGREIYDDRDASISQLLFSFKGVENFLLPQWKYTYEIGTGLYYFGNFKADLPGVKWNETDEWVEQNQTTCGFFAGGSMGYKITDTFYITAKGRMHHVLLTPKGHSYLDLLLGVTLI